MDKRRIDRVFEPGTRLVRHPDSFRDQLTDFETSMALLQPRGRPVQIAYPNSDRDYRVWYEARQERIGRLEPSGLLQGRFQY
jgi:hypothetical protein